MSTDNQSNESQKPPQEPAALQSSSEPNEVSEAELEYLTQETEALSKRLDTINKSIPLICFAIGAFFLINTFLWTPTWQFFSYGNSGHPLPQWRLNIGFIISLILIVCGAIKLPNRKSRTLITPQAIITYHEMNPFKHFDPTPVEAKLREILATLPGAVLTPYEEPLNIKILNVQRIPPKPEPAPSSAPPPKPPGIYIGE